MTDASRSLRAARWSHDHPDNDLGLPRRAGARRRRPRRAREGPGQALRRHPRRRRRRPRRRAGRGAGPARTQRRGQDDDDRGPGGLSPSRRRRRRGARRRPGAGRPPLADAPGHRAADRERHERPHRRGGGRPLRGLLPASSGRGRGDRRRRPDGETAHPWREPVRRAAASPRRRARHHRGPRAALPRRADHRLRPGGPPRVLGPHPGAARGRYDDPAHDPLPRRGRGAGRSCRGDRARPCHRLRRAVTPGRSRRVPRDGVLARGRGGCAPSARANRRGSCATSPNGSGARCPR